MIETVVSTRFYIPISTMITGFHTYQADLNQNKMSIIPMLIFFPVSFRHNLKFVLERDRERQTETQIGRDR